MSFISRVSSGLKKKVSRTVSGAKKIGSRTMKIARKTADLSKKAIQKGRDFVAKTKERLNKSIGGKILIRLIEASPLGQILAEGDQMAKDVESVINKAENIIENIDKYKDVKSAGDLIEKLGSDHDKLPSNVKQNVDEAMGKLFKNHPKTKN